MTTITPQELERDSLRLLERVEAGERIAIARGSRIVAELRPVEERTADAGLRPYGLAAGQFTLPADFDDPLPDDLLREFDGQ